MMTPTPQPSPDALPALPEPVQYEHREPRERYTAEQMLEFRREGIEASRAVRAEPDNTQAYAEGRGDQFEDDCAAVRLLFDNLNDVDVMGDGFINTTRVRELLGRFDVPAPADCSGIECSRPECEAMGCTADRINGERERLITLATHQPQAAESVPAKITNIERSFRFDGFAQHHVPQLIIEFEPVPVGLGTDARGWTDRNALAAALAKTASQA